MCFLKKTPRSIQSKLEKITKIYPEKNSLYFRKWNFLALILKKFSKRKPPKKFLIFKKTEEKLLIFQETEPFSPPGENFLYFRKRKPRKNPYTSRNGTFLYFRKQNFLIFRERYIWNLSIFRTLSNIYDWAFCKNSYVAHFSASALKIFS